MAQFGNDYDSSIVVTGLASGTSYEAHLKGVCADGSESAYSSIRSFTTTACPVPANPREQNVLPTTASLLWDYTGNASSGQWRVAGTSDWPNSFTTSANTSTYSLTGLTAGVAYEWQVKTQCSPSSESAFSVIRSFTAQCSMPGSLTESTGSNSASLRWQAPLTPTFNTIPVTLQWRLAGSTSWITVPTLYSSYNLAGLTEGQVYEWRLASQCAEGLGSYTASRLFTAQCSVPIFVGYGSVSSTGARISWSGPSPASYSVRWRAAGSNGTWTEGLTVTNFFSYDITGLTNAATYEAQVRMVCSGSPAVWSASTVFTTSCNVPFISTPSVYAVSAGLQWGNYVAVAYTLEWRQAGAASWTNSMTLTTSSVSLTGLASATGYEARVKMRCADGIETIYSNVRSFTTTSCPMPTNANELAIYPTVATVNWDYQSQIQYQLQYRQVGTANWSGLLAVPAFTSYYSLTGLTTGTTYEWQVKAVCSVLSESPFSTPRPFTAQCTAPLFVYPASSVSSSGALVYWQGSATSSNPYSVRWRVQNSATWTEGPTVTNTSYTITGLTNGNVYEWQVRMICSGTPTGWSTSGTFTTQCLPTYMNTPQSRPTSTYFSWDSKVQSTYQLEWRMTGAASWTTLLTGTNNYAEIYSLTPNTAYEARVLVLCGDGSNGGYSAIRSFNTPAAADLSLAMAVDKRTPAVNEVVTFTGVVSNEGPQLASGVQVVSLLPPNMVFVSSGQAGVTSSGGAVSVAVGTLPVGTSTTFAFSTQVTQPGVYRTAAQLTSASVQDTDSYLNSGTSDGDDDAAMVDLRTSEAATTVFSSPNPTPRFLPSVISSQPIPLANESDLSIDIRPRLRTLVSGGTTTIDIVISNRGGMVATTTFVEFKLPNGWLVNDSSVGQNDSVTYFFIVSNVGVGQSVTRSIPVQVVGSGEQTIRTRIFASSYGDSDSPHNNDYGLGEDDEATATIRVR